VALRTTGRGCDVFRLDVLGGEETELDGASTEQSALSLRASVGGRESEHQPGGSRGDDGLPGPTGLDLYGRRMTFSWEWRDGDRLRSDLRLDTVGTDTELIDRVGSQEAPANIVTPVGDRGRIFAGARRLGGEAQDRLLRLRISTGEYTQAPQGAAHGGPGRIRRQLSACHRRRSPRGAAVRPRGLPHKPTGNRRLTQTPARRRVKIQGPGRAGSQGRRPSSTM